MVQDEMTAEERLRRAERIYADRLKRELEPSHVGAIVAIDVASGEYFLGRDPTEALARGRQRCPSSVLACLRVGGGPVYRIGRL